jgi:hypothetical protein
MPSLYTQNELYIKEIQGLLLEHLQGSIVQRSNKRRAIDPTIWGPHAWRFLESVVNGYPVRPSHGDKVHMLDFLTSLGHVLPCNRCRESYTLFTATHPPIAYVGNRKRVKKWLQAYRKTGEEGGGEKF